MPGENNKFGKNISHLLFRAYKKIVSPRHDFFLVHRQNIFIINN